MGIKPSVSQNWSRSSIKDILTNPTYTGKVRWQWRKEIKTIEDGKIAIHRPKRKIDEYILIDGLHPAIISEEIFNKAQKNLTEKYIPPVASNKDIKNPLARLIICDKCGAVMTRINSHTGEFLKCPNQNCSNISSKLELVESALLEMLENWLLDYKINFIGKCQKADGSYYLTAIKSLSDKLNTLKSQLTNTYTLLEQGVYTIDIFKQRNEAIKNDISITSNRLEQIEAEYSDRMSEDEILDRFIPHTEYLLDVYHSLGYDEAKAKNDILHELLDKVTYIKTKKGTRNKPAPFIIKIYPKILKH